MRKWLEKNKVYFEIFSYLFLGVASIIVAIYSWKTSDKQLDILKLEHQPILNIQRDYKNPYELIIIENVGYHLFEVNVNIDTYFEIEKIDYNLPKNRSVNMFRIDDYFDLVSNTDNTTGRISTIYSTEYYDNECKRIFREFNLLKNKLNYYIEIKSILKITYKNESHESLNKFYLIDAFSIIEISKSVYNLKYKELNKIYNNGQSKILKQIKAVDLLKIKN